MNDMVCFFILFVVHTQGNSETSEGTSVTCNCTKNVNSTRTDFTVYFYLNNNNPELLTDCEWEEDQLKCIEQEGVKCKRPVSDIVIISLAARFLNKTGTYKCVSDGSRSEDSVLCQFQFPSKKQLEDKNYEKPLKENFYEDVKIMKYIFAAFGVTGLITAGLVVTVVHQRFHMKKPIKSKIKILAKDEEISCISNERGENILEWIPLIHYNRCFLSQLLY